MASKFCCLSCSQYFSDPRLLPCLHVLCKDCLEPLYYQDEGTITCPTCNKTSSCKPPGQLPRHLRIEKETRLARMEQNPEETFCAIVKQFSCIFHVEKSVKYYCSDCCLLICSKCLFAHKEHEWGPITNTELITKKKDELLSLLPVMEDTIAPIDKAIENIDEIVKNIQVNKEREKEKIKESFKMIADATENRCAELIQDIENIAVAKTTQLQIQKESFDKVSISIKPVLEAGSNACSKEYSNVEFLAVTGSIVKASNELVQEMHTIGLHPVTNDSLNVVINCTQLMESISSVGNIIGDCAYPPLCSLLDINPNLAIGIAIDSEGVVILQTRNSKGVDLTAHGSAIVIANVTDPSSGSKVGKCIVTDIDNGQYEISFSIPTEVRYYLNITIDGTSINPYNVNIKDYTNIKITATLQSNDNHSVAVTIDNQYYVGSSNSIKVCDNNLTKVEKTIDMKANVCCIAIDNSNGVMFVSLSNDTIIKTTLDGKVISSIGTTGNGKLEFDRPRGLCLTSDGLLLVADWGNYRVQVFGSDLSFIRFISCSSLVFGVSVDHCGNIHAVTDRRVMVFSITGEKITEYGEGVLKSGARDVAFPLINKSQYSFVADDKSSCIRIFDWSNNTKLHTIDCMGYPRGLTIDQEGAIIVCTSDIYKFQ